MKRFLSAMALVIALAATTAYAVNITFVTNTDVDAAAELISSSAPTQCIKVIFKAGVNNTDVVWVSEDSVSPQLAGFPLGISDTLTLDGGYFSGTIGGKGANYIDTSAFYVSGESANQAISLACIGP